MSTCLLNMPHITRDLPAVFTRVSEYHVPQAPQGDVRPKSRKKLKRLRKLHGISLNETNARILSLLKVNTFSLT